MRKGFTLLELALVIFMVIVLSGVSLFVFRTVLLSWSSQETMAGMDISLNSGVEKVVRDLRQAKEVQAANDEIRFTRDYSTYYIYYLYHAADSYAPPPAFNQSVYQLRRASLGGDIDGNFTYGTGQLFLTDILPPPASDLSFNNSMVTLDLSVNRGDETIRTKTEIRPRNL